MDRDFEVNNEEKMLPLEYYLEDIEVEVDLKRKFKEEKLELIVEEAKSLKSLEIIKGMDIPKEILDKIAIEKKNRKIFENIRPNLPNFCTLVNEKTFIKGLTLYKSLYKNQQLFHMWIVCTDAITYSVLCRMGLENCTPVLISELGEYDFLEDERLSYRDKYYNRLQELASEYISKKYGVVNLEICEPDIFYFSGYQYAAKAFDPDEVIKSDELLHVNGINEVYFEGQKIIAFKFTGFQILNDEEFDLWSGGSIPESSNALRWIYLPYIREVKETIEEIKQRGMLKTEVFYSGFERDQAVNYYSLKGGVS